MWPRLLAAAVGVWLMAAPDVLGYGGAPAFGDRIAGPLAVGVAAAAIAPVTRSARWGHVPLGLWLLVAPWVLGAPADATVSDLLCGVALVGLAFLAGRVRERFDGGWMETFRALMGRAA